MLILLLLLSMFLRIDATGEQEYSYNYSPVAGPSAEADSFEERIALSQIRQSLDRMLLRRENHYRDVPINEIPEDLYDQRTNYLLDMYSNAIDINRGDDVAEFVLNLINSLKRDLQAKGVELPKLNALDNPAHVNAELFKNVGLRNGEPLTPFDRAIWDIFKLDILRQSSAPPLEAKSSLYVSPHAFQRASTASPYIGSHPSRQQPASLPAPESASALDQVVQLLREPARDQSQESIENQVAAIPAGEGIEELTLPDAVSPANIPQEGQRKRSSREEENKQDRNVKRKVEGTPPLLLLDRPPHQHDHDDENEPSGEGIYI